MLGAFPLAMAVPRPRAPVGPPRVAAEGHGWASRVGTFFTRIKTALPSLRKLTRPLAWLFLPAATSPLEARLDTEAAESWKGPIRIALMGLSCASGVFFTLLLLAGRRKRGN